MSEEKSPLSVEQMHDITMAQFLGSLDALNKGMIKVSNRGMKRVIHAALNHNITNAEFDFRNEAEARLAALLAKILDLRVDIKALKFEKENNDG